MGKENNLKDYLTDLYEGIASKKSDASRNPQDFRSEIEAIETGITPSGSKTITENGEGIDVTSYATVDVAVPDNTEPPELSNEAEINALPVGAVFKYVGASGTYENGAYYLVESNK